MSAYSLRVEQSELNGALSTLQLRILESSGAEADRLLAGVRELNTRDSAWVLMFFHDGVLHMTPGPRLLELLAPTATLAIPRARRVNRLARVLFRVRALVREVIGR